jgi:hypothetical protein
VAVVVKAWLAMALLVAAAVTGQVVVAVVVDARPRGFETCLLVAEAEAGRREVQKLVVALAQRHAVFAAEHQAVAVGRAAGMLLGAQAVAPVDLAFELPLEGCRMVG